MFKPLLFIGAMAALSALNACSSESANAPRTAPSATQSTDKDFPTLTKRLACLPEEGALVAAHGGVSRRRGLAENSLESLEALYAGGVRIAEIDVAQLRSGEHILFHDGVWEEKSTGQGAVASSQWSGVEAFLLTDTEGGLTTFRPVLLKDALAYAKGRLHLEIDFKSSADYSEVINLIRNSGMSGDVVLIAYNERQAKALARLAPDMFISVSVKSGQDISSLEKTGVKRSQMMGWVGRSKDRALMTQLRRQDIPVLTQEAGRRKPYREADIFVTDYALNKNLFLGAVGLSQKQKTNYQRCLLD